MALLLTQSLIEIIFLGSKALPAHKVDNFTAVFEPDV
jgi:hypothetical protein